MKIILINIVYLFEIIFFTRNYIGFEDCSDLDKFLKIDFNLYKKKFQNRVCAIFAIISLIIFTVLIVIEILIIINKPSNSQMNFLYIGYLVIFLGFFIHSLVLYTKVYESEDLSIERSIKSISLILGLKHLKNKEKLLFE